jgi:hypothetical protein
MGVHKQKDRLRCHKRPKSREEMPKEGSDSGGAHPIDKTMGFTDPIRRFMRSPLKPTTSAPGVGRHCLRIRRATASPSASTRPHQHRARTTAIGSSQTASGAAGAGYSRPPCQVVARPPTFSRIRCRGCLGAAVPTRCRGRRCIWTKAHAELAQRRLQPVDWGKRTLNGR